MSDRDDAVRSAAQDDAVRSAAQDDDAVRSTARAAAAKSAAANLFDLRRIIGTLFGIYGVILTIMGLAFTSDADLEKAADVNINLWTGLAMLATAAAFWAWALLRPVRVEELEQGPGEATPGVEGTATRGGGGAHRSDRH